MPDTQQQILEAAIVVLNDDWSASMDKIAGQAGVTRRTLHRYFADRQDLYASCQQEMRRSCQQAMSAAYASSADAGQQLERLLYASIDCGTKYAFLHKLFLLPAQAPDPERDPEPFQLLHRVLATLQQQGALRPELPVPWLTLFFLGVVQATIYAETSGAVARQALKSLAWTSFRQGIGLVITPLPAPADARTDLPS